MTETVKTFDYAPSAAASRLDRDSSMSAVHHLEEALSGPAPGRQRPWLDRVERALTTLEAALEVQGATDGGERSLLSEIAHNEPRLVPRIERLRDEHRDIGTSIVSLRRQIPGATEDAQIDIADLRDRLSSIARRVRQHRAREADLVYEAVNIDLGAGD